jgi:hypothetical protein
MRESSSPVGGGERRCAQRFLMTMPLLYQVGNKKDDWHSGTIENISTAGIFFRCEDHADLKEHLQITFVLPSRLEQRGGARVSCSSEVVRIEPARGVGALLAVAVRILSSHLLPLKDKGDNSQGPKGLNGGDDGYSAALAPDTK